MSLFPFTDNIFPLLGSPEAATMGSAFGVRADLAQMRESLYDVILLLELIKIQCDGPEYLLDYSFCRQHGWHGFAVAVTDAEDLLDELSMELALRRELGGFRKISLFFSRRNPLAYSRRLSSRIKQINERLAYFAGPRRPDLDGRPWKQLASFVDALDGPRRAFHDLPLRLKHCFAYCLLFPVNYAIDKSTIMQIWIAQGLLPASNANNNSVEEVGHEYFMDLRSKSLFTEIQQDQLGNIVSFKVHSLIYSFAEQVPGWSYLNLFPHPGSSHLSSVQCRYDLEVLLSDDSRFLPLDRARTFLMPYQPRLVNLIDDDTECFYGDLIQSSPRLRVLDLHHAYIKSVPSCIDKLKQLRYLDLSYNTRIEMLPRCITTLWNLQTLKLSYCQRLKELPDDIIKLVNLRHLEIDGCSGLVHMPAGIGQLQHLRTLSMFVVSEKSADESASSKKAGLSELAGLHRLRGGLKLRGLENARGDTTQVKAASMKDKQYLEKLTLEWKTVEATDDDDAVQCSRDDEATLECLEPNLNLKGLCVHGYSGVKFPNWLYSPVHLVKVTLNSCYQCQYLPPLDQLLALKHLTLEKLCTLEYIVGNEPSSSFCRPRQATYFPSLEQLCLRELPNLMGWFEEDVIRDTRETLPTSFSVLSMVTIDDCPKLSMPLLPSVRSLRVNKTDKIQLESFLQLSLPRPPLSHPDRYEASYSSDEHANLKSLCISYVKDLDHLPGTYFSKLPSLEDLEIRHCPSLLDLPPLNSLTCITILGCQRLTSLSGWIDHLTALESLKLHGCPELDLTQYRSRHRKEDVDLRLWPEFELLMSRDDKEPELGSSSASDGCAIWGSLKRLTSLEIVDIPKLVFLPEGLRLATSLQKFELTACSGLIELPEWISEFQSLNELVLSFCPSLALLPEAFANLRRLSKLKIIGCPLLKLRYNKETGSGWKDIAHVGDVEVR